MTTSEGKFTFTDLEPGMYTLRVALPDAKSGVLAAGLHVNTLYNREDVALGARLGGQERPCEQALPFLHVASCPRVAG